MKWCEKPKEYRIEHCDTPCLVCLPKVELEEGEKDISGVSCCGHFGYRGIPFRCRLGEEGIDICEIACVRFSEHDYMDWIFAYKDWDKNGFYVCKHLIRTRKVKK